LDHNEKIKCTYQPIKEKSCTELYHFEQIKTILFKGAKRPKLLTKANRVYVRPKLMRSMISL